MSGEFALIERYFTRPTPQAVLGVGDDAAILAPTPGHELLASSDTLVEGVHFFAGTEPEALGWKTLAVNVSDIAAMGGTPRWALLALTLPAVDEEWLAAFARGFHACAEAQAVALVGGDTTGGPRSFTVTVLGEVPAGMALRRSGARVGDELWISGWPGRAALALRHLRGELILAEPLRTLYLAALHRPQPRRALGLALRGLASAAIDVSDGLLADLGHVLRASGVAARVDAAVPTELTLAVGEEAARAAFFAGGDDYELLFSVPPDRRTAIEALAVRLDLPLCRIGRIEAGEAGAIVDGAGQPYDGLRGYEHFAA